MGQTDRQTDVQMSKTRTAAYQDERTMITITGNFITC